LLFLTCGTLPARAGDEAEPRDQPVVAVLKLVQLKCLVAHDRDEQGNGHDDLYFATETKNSWSPESARGRIPRGTGVISAAKAVEVPLHRGTIPLDQTTEVTIRLMDRARGGRGSALAKETLLGEFRVLLRNSGGRLRVNWQTRGAAKDDGPVDPPRAEDKAKALHAARRRLLLTGGGARYEAVLEATEGDPAPGEDQSRAAPLNTVDSR
jgi:hypothetical protein